MAKRKLKLNPSDIRGMKKDVEEIITASGSNIGMVYLERKKVERDLKSYENVIKRLEARREEIGLDREQKATLRRARGAAIQSRVMIRKLDADIVRYGRVHIRRMKERLEVLSDVPGVALRRDKVNAFKRALFKFEQKVKDLESGADIRKDVVRLETFLTGMESEAAAWQPRKEEVKVSKREKAEAGSLPALWLYWARVRALAAPHPQLAEDIAEIQGRMEGFRRAGERGIATLVAPGKTEYRPLTRVESRKIRETIAGQISKLERFARTLGRPVKTYEDATKMLHAFVEVMKEYGKGDVSGAGVDKLLREFDKLTTSIKSTSMSTWTRDQQRRFGGTATRVRKTLAAMKRTGKRRKKARKAAANPTRVSAADKRFASEMFGNPPVEEKEARRQRAAKAEKRKAKKRQEKHYERRRRAKAAKNPLIPVTERTSDKAFRAAVSANIATEMKAGKEQRQAIAIALSTARKQAPIRSKKLYGAAPMKNPCMGLHFHAKDADELLQALEQSAKRQRKEIAGKGRTANPKKAKKRTKKAAKKKVTRKKSSPSERLIRRCQKLWEHYCERPGKKRLKAVLEHLETMKASTSKTVKSERSRCLRAANAEAKRLRMK